MEIGVAECSTQAQQRARRAREAKKETRRGVSGGESLIAGRRARPAVAPIFPGLAISPVSWMCHSTPGRRDAAARRPVAPSPPHTHRRCVVGGKSWVSKLRALRRVSCHSRGQKSGRASLHPRVILARASNQALNSDTGDLPVSRPGAPRSVLLAHPLATAQRPRTWRRGALCAARHLLPAPVPSLRPGVSLQPRTAPPPAHLRGDPLAFSLLLT